MPVLASGDLLFAEGITSHDRGVVQGKQYQVRHALRLLLAGTINT